MRWTNQYIELISNAATPESCFQINKLLFFICPSPTFTTELRCCLPYSQKPQCFCPWLKQFESANNRRYLFYSCYSQIYSRILSVQQNNISVANCKVAGKVKTSRCLQGNNLHWKRLPEWSNNRKPEHTWFTAVDSKNLLSY